MIDAFVFDLDGTLLDSEIVWVEAYDQFLRTQGFAIEPAEALSIVYGRAYSFVYEETCRRFPALGLDAEELADRLRVVFQGLTRTRDLRIHGSVNLLKHLARQHPVCVVSGSPRADVAEGVRLAGINGDLRFFLGSEDYSPGKPDPAGFLMGASRLGVAPGACLVFEDSAAGVQAAKRAGMACVALARPGRPRQDIEAADLVLDDLARFDLAAFVTGPRG